MTESKIERKNVHTAGEFGSRQYWTIVVTYTYTANSKVYTSNKYSSSPPQSSSKNDTSPSPELNHLLEEYPTGRQITVFVSPNNPKRVYIKRAKYPDGRVLAGGIIILFITFYRQRKMQRSLNK